MAIKIKHLLFKKQIAVLCPNENNLPKRLKHVPYVSLWHSPEKMICHLIDIIIFKNNAMAVVLLQSHYHIVRLNCNQIEPSY